MVRVVWGVVLLSIVATGAVTASGGPLADAGLDQTVDQHSRVYLDAGGSVAPDGDIESYEWVIERPDGSTVEPDCATCAQTSFVADAAGEYAVTVTVADDSGATASDTLYVTVRNVAPPTATLRGPTAVERGNTVTYELDGEAGDRGLAAYELAVDGDRADRTVVDDGSPREMTVTFSEAGERVVTGNVIDERGVAGADTLAVEVTESGCAGCADIGFGGGGGDGAGGGGAIGTDVTVYEGGAGETKVEISAPGAALDPDGTTSFRMGGEKYEIDNSEYNKLQYDNGQDSTSKEYDVSADEVLVDGNADQLEEAARDEGEVETFEATGDPDKTVIPVNNDPEQTSSEGAVTSLSDSVESAADAVGNIGGSIGIGGGGGGGGDGPSPQSVIGSAADAVGSAADSIGDSLGGFGGIGDAFGGGGGDGGGIDAGSITI